MSPQLDLFAQPVARSSDPLVSHLAAGAVKSCNAEMIMAIRRYVFQVGPSTAFQIADALAPILGRQPDSIRTAVSRAGLTMWPGGTAPSGRACSLYGTTGITVPTHGRV